MLAVRDESKRVYKVILDLPGLELLDHENLFLAPCMRIAISEAYEHRIFPTHL